MNHYPHHIGDFAKDTLGFSQGAIGAYRLLMDAYYANEAAIPADDVYVIGRATTPAERKAVDKVLTKFELRDGLYYHKRIEEELAAFRDRSETGKRNIANRWQKTKQPDSKSDSKPDSNEIPNEYENGSESILASSHKPENLNHPGERSPGDRTTEAPNPPPRAPSGFQADEGRVKALVALCQSKRVRVSWESPHIRQWVGEGLTDEQMRLALERAHQRNGGQSISMGFLSLMVEDIRAGVGPSSTDPAEVVKRAAARIAAKEASNATH